MYGIRIFLLLNSILEEKIPLWLSALFKVSLAVPNDFLIIELPMPHLGLSEILVRCSGLTERPPTVWSWRDALSRGERQRLCFLRLLHHSPEVALLDEATSAVSADMETQLMNALADAGVTVISVGHRDSLQKHHSKVLRLKGDEGLWSVDDLLQIK